jgi:hypothetical protein
VSCASDTEQGGLLAHVLLTTIHEAPGDDFSRSKEEVELSAGCPLGAPFLTICAPRLLGFCP